MNKQTLLAVVMLILPQSLAAHELDRRGFSADASLGVVGSGYSAAYRFNRHVGLRFISRSFSDSYDINLGVIDAVAIIETTINADFNNRGLLADIHPFGNDFFIVAGFYNAHIGFDVALEGRTGQLITSLGENIYFEGSIRGDIDYSGVMTPYYGIGWQERLSEKGRLGLGIELGIIQLPEPRTDVQFNLSTLSIAGFTLSSNPAFVRARERELARIEQQANRDLQEGASNLTILPVLELTLRYHF